MRRAAPAALGMLVLAGCVAPKRAAPVVAAPPAVAKLAPPPPEVRGDWQDVPLTPGTWRYTAEPTGSRASYGLPDAPVLTLACDRARGQVTIARPGTMPAAMTVRTSYGTRELPAGGAVLAARDPLLDRIAFSRGRFSVAGAGLPTLFLPAWAEPARVVEDCRGPAA